MYMLGWLWYSPKAFGKMWCDACNVKCDGEKKPPVKSMVSHYIVCVVMAFVISCFVQHNAVDTVQKALSFGFFAWLGFIATSMYGAVIWCKKPLIAYFIDAGYYLVGVVLMSVLFSLWT